MHFKKMEFYIYSSGQNYRNSLKYIIKQKGHRFNHPKTL